LILLLSPICSETHFEENHSLRIADFQMANSVFCTPLEPLKLRATNMHIGRPAILCPRHGRVKNVCPFVDEWLWLISDDYTECQKLGGSAHAEGLAALFAPSARHRPDGVTVPIFLIDAAADPKIEGDVLFIVTATEPTTFDIQIL
jgi:hypothetical protein